MSYQSMDKIVDHLYITNWETSNNISELKRNNIKAILTIETSQKPITVLDYYKKNNIDYLFLYLNDLSTENISKYFEKSYDFINSHINKGENVLVHCRAGVSRSATLVLNYLIRKYYEQDGRNKCSRCVLKYFLNYCKSKRFVINPNPGFINQLISYYQFKK